MDELKMHLAELKRENPEYEELFGEVEKEMTEEKETKEDNAKEAKEEKETKEAPSTLKDMMLNDLNNSIKNDKTFQVINPPLISIIPKIEENINISKNAKNNNQSINESILTKTQNSLKLKRNKPITNPNSTLQSFMDLKII